jgi:hypothetical protein
MGDPSIKVETGELNNFANHVRHQAGDVLQPAVNRASLSMASGVPFGATNASGAVHAAKQRYAQSLSVSMANLEQFVQAAKIMADAAEKVAADFDAVDSRSADAVSRVNSLLASAAKEAEAARIASERAQHPQYGPYGPAAAV